jgi:hypothetical protein
MVLVQAGQLIANGKFRPLTGFVEESEAERVFCLPGKDQLCWIVYAAVIGGKSGRALSWPEFEEGFSGFELTPAYRPLGGASVRRPPSLLRHYVTRINTAQYLAIST